MEILNQAEREYLAGVIAEAETKTAGEIRLMIVKRSAVTGHVGVLLWSVLLVLSFAGIWFWREDLPVLEFWWFWPAVALATLIVTAVLTRSRWLVRHLTPVSDLRHQVWTRAELEFYREGLNGTVAHTGVLLFISLFERQALVLADKAISEKVSPHVWDKIVATMLKGGHHGEWKEPLESAIRQTGEYLAQHFPAAPGKKNELSNDVIVKE